jgi:hypothetical protein
VGGGVPVDSEAPVVTLLISRSAGSISWTQSLGDAHRVGCGVFLHGVRVCTYVLHFTQKKNRFT